MKSKVIDALISNHPYEEVAYEISSLSNVNQNMGKIGKLPKGMKVDAFLEFVKDQLGTPVLRHSKIGVKTIERVVLGGSGSFAIQGSKEEKQMLTSLQT